MLICKFSLSFIWVDVQTIRKQIPDPACFGYDKRIHPCWCCESQMEKKKTTRMLVVGKLETSYNSNDPVGFWENPVLYPTASRPFCREYGANRTTTIYDAFAPELYMRSF